MLACIADVLTNFQKELKLCYELVVLKNVFDWKRVTKQRETNIIGIETVSFLDITFDDVIKRMYNFTEKSGYQISELARIYGLSKMFKITNGHLISGPLFLRLKPVITSYLSIYVHCEATNKFMVSFDVLSLFSSSHRIYRLSGRLHYDGQPAQMTNYDGKILPSYFSFPLPKPIFPFSVIFTIKPIVWPWALPLVLY